MADRKASDRGRRRAKARASASRESVSARATRGPGAGRRTRAELEAALTELERAYRALERRFAERNAALENNERRLRTIIGTIPDAIVTIDEQAVVQSFSAAAERLFGYDAAEVVGKNVNMLMPAPYREAHDDYVGRYLRTGQKRIIGSGRVVVGRRRDGTTFPMELFVGEMWLDERRQFLGAIRDITTRREVERRVQDLQAALQEASRLSALGEMSSGLAHELNQPLSAIINYLDAGQHLLGAGASGVPAKAAEMFDKASRQARRAGDVIQRMRQLARKGETERQVADINTVVQDAVALASVAAPRHDADIDFALGNPLPAILADVTQIQQVVVNLVRNSLEALAETDRPKATVRTESTGDGFVRVAVSDNGPGLEPEIAARLFQPFVTTKAGGTGIGLSICKSIIEGHGGEIAAATNEEGGATFTFTVPVAPLSAC